MLLIFVLSHNVIESRMSVLGKLGQSIAFVVLISEHG